MIWRLFRTHSQDRNIDELYGAIVAQARSPAFYRDYGVPDTVQGRKRFEARHSILILQGPQEGRDRRRFANPAEGRGGMGTHLRIAIL